MFKTIALQILAVTVFAVATVHAQITTPAPSPMAKMEQMIGLTTVNLEYSRPGVKGRTIFAEDGLVPFGEMWRTGANRATTIEFDKDVTVAGTDVPAGKYAILTKPGKDQWEVMFYTETNFNGIPSDFDESKVAATVMAKTMEYPGATVENFTIIFDELASDGANLYMMWDKTIAMLPIGVGTDKETMASIERALNGPSSGDYYAAATYYYESDKDISQAYTWIKQANEMDSAKPKFWVLRRQALIEAKMGKKQDAVATAKKSLQYAQEAGNMDYVRMNEKNIAEWSM